MQVLFPNSISNLRIKEALTADAVQKYLRENKFSVLIENGGMSYINTRCGEGLNADLTTAATLQGDGYGYFLTSATLTLTSGCSETRQV